MMYKYIHNSGSVELSNGHVNILIIWKEKEMQQMIIRNNDEVQFFTKKSQPHLFSLFLLPSDYTNFKNFNFKTIFSSEYWKVLSPTEEGLKMFCHLEIEVD